MNAIKFIAITIMLQSVYVACVTIAAMHFDNPKLLWWYVLVLLLGYSYETKREASK